MNKVFDSATLTLVTSLTIVRIYTGHNKLKIGLNLPQKKHSIGVYCARTNNGKEFSKIPKVPIGEPV